MSDDPTRIRNQPALTTSGGRIWMIVGGLFTVVALAVLIPMTALPPGGVALFGVVAVALLFAGMIVVRLTVAPGRARLAGLAVGMLAIAAISLVCAGIVAATALA
jgi:hypothetical protein